jgi:hypothetical protein
MSDPIPTAQIAEPLADVHVHTIGPPSNRTQRTLSNLAGNLYTANKDAKTYRIFAAAMLSCLGLTGLVCLVWLGVTTSSSNGLGT